MSSTISMGGAKDSASVGDDSSITATIDISSSDLAAAQSEDTNDISSITIVETTTAISTTDPLQLKPINKPSSRPINKFQNVEWRKEWRGIHLPPSAGILNSKFYSKNDIDEIEMESESNEEYIDDVEDEQIEVLTKEVIEVPVVGEEEDTPDQTSIIYTKNQPSIPLYPLLLTIILYHIIKYLFRKIFTFKKRSRFMRSMKCRISSLGGNYEQFTISQSELEGHIEKLKRRNEKKRNKESDAKKKKGKKKGKDGDKNSDGGGKRDDDMDGDDKGMGGETDENENRGGDSSNTNSGSTAGTNNKDSRQQSGNNNRNSYSSTKHSTNHNEEEAIQEYKVKVQQLTQQNEVLLLKVNQLEVENEQLDNEMEHLMDEMCINDEKSKDSHDGKEIDISGSSDTIVESLTDDGDDDTLLQELEDAKINISTLTKEQQVVKEEVLNLSMEVAKLTNDKEDLEQRLKDEQGKGYQHSSSYNALRAERNVLNDTLLDINKSMQDAHDIVSELAEDSMEQDDTSLEAEDAKSTHEIAKHSALRILSQLSHIKKNGRLLPPPASPPLSPTSLTDQASFDRFEMGRKAHKMMEKSVISSTVSSAAAGDLCLVDSSSPRHTVDRPTSRELFPSQGQVKEVVLLPKILPPQQSVAKDCTILAVDSQHTQDETKCTSSSSSVEESSAGGGECNSSVVNSDDSMDQRSISYGMNETYCSDDDYDDFDNDLIVGFKDSILNLSKATAASRDVDAIQRSRGLSKLVRIWSKRSERSSKC